MATTDYRYDQFQDVLNSINITGETHTIPSVSPYIIRLNEVPLKNNPSSISLTIGGIKANEVSSQPAAGEFWPDYSTNADNDETWNTGTILFNVADAGKSVVVTYKGTGNMVWARETSQTFVFTESGTITAPPWANFALLSGCGGGGGGSNAGSRTHVGAGGGAGSHVINLCVKITSGVNYVITIGTGGKGGVEGKNPTYFVEGASGGITSFGNIISLTGGGGGGNDSPGTTDSNVIGGGYVPALGAIGGSGLFGIGGAARTAGYYGVGNPGAGYGSGGGGGEGFYNGGSSAVRFYAGGSGAAGILIVKWVA